MPKKIFFESSVHHILSAARHLAEKEGRLSQVNHRRWTEFISSLNFRYLGSGSAEVTWTSPQPGIKQFDIRDAQFYVRGDTDGQVELQQNARMLFRTDVIREDNERLFRDLVTRIAEHAGLMTAGHHEIRETEAMAKGHLASDHIKKRLSSEERFFDNWAASENLSAIDVRLINESCTSPELRFIRQRLGDINDRTILDVGCGLGEASVYFALEGASVTATDISEGMLRATQELARLNGVSVTTHRSAAEDLHLSRSQKFDVIYAGNLFHHVDIESTLDRIIPHLSDHGVVVSWDPVAYNPLINIYRWIAQDARTHDEHPLNLSDIKKFKRRFQTVETRWFWLTTLLLFVWMFVVQRQNPNKVRFWKKVVEEGNRWAWIYTPLERFDSILLRLFPFLRPLCWNVAIIASAPKRIGQQQ